MKEQALWLYQRMTTGCRQKLLDQLRQQGNVPIAVLFYHRIANQYRNDWTMSHRDFAAQLDWLQANYDVVPLEEAQRRVRSPVCDRPTVAITFDDGYSDNADFAIPELFRRGLPATYFVTTEFVRTGKPFPHDARAGRPLKPNTIDELKAIVDMGIEIGAHTQNHVDCGAITCERQLRAEIIGSIEQLQRWLGRRIRYFAFPYGLPHNTSQAAVDLLSSTELEAFCTAFGAWNWPRTEGYHLRRIHADPQIQRLRNWLTFDPRKIDDCHMLPFREPVFSSTDRIPGPPFEAASNLSLQQVNS